MGEGNSWGGMSNVVGFRTRIKTMGSLKINHMICEATRNKVVTKTTIIVTVVTANAMSPNSATATVITHLFQSYIILILQIRKLRPKEINLVFPSHKASKQN